MSQPNIIAISIASDLPEDERTALLLALRAHANVQESQSKALDWETVLAVIKQAGEIADAFTNMAALATMLYGWAQGVRKRGHTPRARLERPNQPPLDLATADEHEVLAWLLQSPTTPSARR